MDNGEVLQGLNAKWTFLGATLMEWSSGVVMFMIISLFSDSPVKGMPFMLAGLLLTSFMMASLRRAYPDEERGVRNALMSACGIRPQDIPAPAALQPVWSACPVKEIDSEKRFVKLGFSEIFPSYEESLMADDFLSEE